MGKLMDRLQKQLQDEETKQDAQECIKVYNWISETDPEGRVMESRWNPMVKVTFKKGSRFPNATRIYELNITGKTLLKGIESDK